MKFNIIDGNEDYLDKISEFVELYNSNTVPVVTIREKLNLTLNQYRKLRKHCYEEGLIKLRRNYPSRKQKTENPKHYCRRVEKGNIYYAVYKNGEYYTICKTEKEAVKIVAQLKECDWDKSQVKYIKETVIKNEVF